MNRLCRRYCILSAVLMLGSCGLFTPRTDFEQPIGENDNDQLSLSFASLLDGTEEEFTRLDLNELFSDSLLYTNIRSVGKNYKKNEMISHLQQPSIKASVISWNNNGDFLPSSDTIDLRNVTYTVKKATLPDSIVASGTSRFIIIRSDKKWQIMTWQDVPKAGPAFFLPVAE